jgi:thiopurine S-methyltransferase
MSDRLATRSTPPVSATSFQAAVLVIAAASALSYFYSAKLATKATTTTRAEPTNNELPIELNNDRLKFWNDRWTAGKTRWHKTEVHPSLKKYVDEILLEGFPGGGARILVPLCGKTVDMEHLARKRKVAEVVGVDGVRSAMEAFAKEHPDLDLQPPADTNVGGGSVGGFEKWKGQSISLLTGDFFQLDVATAGGTFDAVWDRASLVAIQPSLREQYVAKTGELISKPNGRILLSTSVRSNGDTQAGPPFSIDEAEVRRLYEGQPWVESVELLDSHSSLSQEGWYEAIRLYYRFGNPQENIFLIKTK